MRRITFFMILIGVIFTSTIYLHAADYLSRAVVTDIQGKATYSSSMQSGKLTKGIALSQSYTIKTEKDSTATLILTSGVAIKLLPGTIMTIDTLDILSNGLPKSDSQAPLRRVEFNLRKGAILVNIPKGTKNIELKVQTKFGLITVNQPSVFQVSATNSSAEAKAGLGSLNVKTKTDQLLVLAGESVLMVKDEIQKSEKISTVEILAFSTTSSETLTAVFKNANPENTQDVLDSIVKETGSPSNDKPTTTSRPPQPKASDEPLPPEPIMENDPSPSTL